MSLWFTKTLVQVCWLIHSSNALCRNNKRVQKQAAIKFGYCPFFMNNRFPCLKLYGKPKRKIKSCRNSVTHQPPKPWKLKPNSANGAMYKNDHPWLLIDAHKTALCKQMIREPSTSISSIMEMVVGCGGT